MELNIQNPIMDIVTVCVGNQILTIAGSTSLRAGVCEVWLLLDKCYKKYKTSLVRALKILMEDYLVKERGFYRLQMAIDAAILERSRWAEYLGFFKEGLMKAYDTEGRDHYLYARVF